jgi:4a-hydroxytetrahydrobiopterin dehydratase
MVSTGTINNYTITVLTTKQIKANLKAVANWSQREQSICRMFKFEGFLNSVAFVNRITPVAQSLNHYPDIDIRFDQVTLTLTTHDAGGITEKDFSVARQCDEVCLSFFCISIYADYWPNRKGLNVMGIRIWYSQSVLQRSVTDPIRLAA